MIWETCNRLEDAEFEKMVDTFIRSMRAAPLPKAFEEQARKLISRRIYESRREDVITRSEHEHKPRCAYCCDTGVVEARIIGESNAIHFRCDCGAESTWAELPMWGNEWGMEFARIPMWPERSKKWVPTKDRTFEQLQDEWKARLQISVEYWTWRNKI